MKSHNLRSLVAAAFLLAATVPSGYATWYHDSTTNYLEAENWLEKSSGDWQTMRWHRVGDDGDDVIKQAGIAADLMSELFRRMIEEL